ncbi:hemolysin-III channel protein Izh2 [Penicillium angulare]|uniref:Hemolysin-III channel protein Izh2 n=1 Tax=Penicillium angulare TaxID=116970 RepID=A0A9W9K6V4_9EURO|nr:hemolysin-III channel protein Izh2 [Penicillium angulare]
MEKSPRQRKHASLQSVESSAQLGVPHRLHFQQYQDLLSYNELPEWYQDNPFIHVGYRPVSNSTRKCFASLLYLHNESVNIYSHLIPAIAFLVSQWCLYQYLQVWYPSTSLDDQIIFAFFLLTASICLGLSATYHTLASHSHDTCNRWLQLDFIGIVILTLGDFISGIHMIFYCEPDLKLVYWGMIATLSLISVMILLNPKFQGPTWRTFRVGAFIATRLSGIAPLVHGVRIFGFGQMAQFGMPFYLIEGLLLIIGAAVYTVCLFVYPLFRKPAMLTHYKTRVPESLNPGKFDIFGSSHQIFHVLVVLATITQFVGILGAFDYNHHHRMCELA